MPTPQRAGRPRYERRDERRERSGPGPIAETLRAAFASNRQEKYVMSGEPK